MSKSKLIGQWDKAIKTLDALGDEITKEVKVAVLQSALELERIIVRHFERQDLGWKELSDPYLKYKKRKGLSQAILISTSTMVNSVTHQIVDGGLGAFVGFLRTAKRKDGEDPVMIARVHEYGFEAKGIPARPSLRPSFKEAQPKIKERMRAAISKVLNERFAA